VSALPAKAPVRTRPSAPPRKPPAPGRKRSTVPARERTNPSPRAPGRPVSPSTSRTKRPRKAQLRVVKPARRPRRSRAPLLILSGMMIAGLLVGIVTLQALVSQTSFRMQDLQARTHTLQLQYGQLKAQTASLSAPARIAAAARRQGMVLPDASQVQTLRVPGLTPAASKSARAVVPPSAALKPVIGEGT